MTPGRRQNLWRVLLEAADGPARWLIGSAIGLGVACAVMAAVSPLALKHVIDSLSLAIGDGPPSTQHGGQAGNAAGGLAWLVFYLTATAGVRFGAQLQAWSFASGDQRVQARLSVAVFRRAACLPLPVHRASAPGALLQTHAQLLQGVRTLLSLAALSFLPMLVQLAVMMVVVAREVGSVLVPFLAGTMALYAGVFIWGVRRATRAARDALTAQVSAAAWFADCLANAETIKNDVAEERVTLRYREAAETTARAWRLCYLRRAELGLLVASLFGFSLFAALGFAFAGASVGRLSAGDFVLVNACLLQVIAPVEALGFAVRDAAQAMAHVREGVALLARPTETPVVARKTERADAGPAPAIHFDGVDLVYGDGRAALQGLDFEIPAGARVVILGASGSGKSSLLRLILRHEAPTAGRVLFDGQSIAERDVRAHRSSIGVVSQEIILYRDTLRANLLAARSDASEADLARVVRHAHLDKMVGGLPDGLDTFVGDRGLNLSGGERQRVALARALLRNARVLLLDEPTSALDPETERLIAQTLFEGPRISTVMMVTHRLAFAARADAVIVLADGRLIERGGHAQLLAAGGAYARLWRAAGQNASQDASKGTKHG